MNNIDIQKTYWDSITEKKSFTHPIFMNIFSELISVENSILDYGCGYGRTCNELSEYGYNKVVGIDISSHMIDRGKVLYPNLDLLYFDGKKIPFPDESFFACTLLAVLTCIPTNTGQMKVINEIHRVIRPGGILYISDYPIQKDQRNQERYQQYENEFDTYGIFRISDGGVLRHHYMSWIYKLLSEFIIIREDRIEVCTMNGNVAEAFQLIVKKKETGQPANGADGTLIGYGLLGAEPAVS
jgi:SAM-dependent methyltransferase